MIFALDFFNCETSNFEPQIFDYPIIPETIGKISKFKKSGEELTDIELIIKDNYKLCDYNISAVTNGEFIHIYTFFDLWNKTDICTKPMLSEEERNLVLSIWEKNQ